MKEIRIEIRPQLLGQMQEALRACPGFPGMSVSQIQAYPPPPAAGAHSLKEDLTEFVHRVRIEIVCSDEHAEAFYAAALGLLEHGRTGESCIRMSEVLRATFLHLR